MKKVCLNLGCGKDIRKGWINVDKIPFQEVDVVWDLNKIPYPFKDNSADFILMSHVLEHLDNIPDVMDEIYRILKPNGILHIIAPHYKAKRTFRDPTHKHFFTEESLDYFIEDTKCRKNFPYSKYAFKLIRKRLFRDAFPFWHLKKYLGIDLKLPIFPNSIEWILQKPYGGVNKIKRNKEVMKW